MTRYIVEGPDGKRYIVEGPSDGAAGAGAGPGPAQGVPKALAPQETYQRAGGYGPTMAGVADAGIKGFLGLKQLVGMGSKEDKDVLEQMRQEKEADPESGWRTGGEALGNIAATAIPGSAAARGIQGVKALSSLPRVAAMLGAGGSSAATEFALASGEGDSYGEQLLSKSKEAAKAAAMGAGITAGIGALAKPLTGLFKAKPDAEALYAQGVNPTLQQGAAGAPGRFIGGLTAGVQNLRTRLNDQFGNAHLKRITEGNVAKEEGIGEEFADAAKKYVSDEYDRVWDGVKVQLSPRMREGLVARAGKVRADGIGADEAAEASRLMANRLGVRDGVSDATTNYNMNAETARKLFRTPISQDAFAAQGQVKERLLDARKAWDRVQNKALSPDKLARKQEVDSLNYDAKRLEEATSGTRLSKEGVDISRLAAAYGNMRNQGKALGNTTFEDLVAPANRIMDSTPSQNTARSAWAAARRAIPIALAGGAVGGGVGAGAAALAPFAAISLLGQTGPGAKALLGQYDTQKALAELIRKYGAQAGGVAGSTFTDEEE